MVDAVREAINQLSPTLKQVIILHSAIGNFMEGDGLESHDPDKMVPEARGMRNNEIAPLVGKTPQHVGNLLAKARSEIRKTLRKMGHTKEDFQKYFPGHKLEEFTCL